MKTPVIHPNAYIAPNATVVGDVHIGAGAHVENCIVMQGTVISDGAVLHSVITDKNVSIKEHRTLCGFDSYPVFIQKGATV